MEPREDVEEEVQDDAFDESQNLSSPAVELSRDKKGLKRKTSIFKYYSFKSTGIVIKIIIFFFFRNFTSSALFIVAL